MKNLFFYSLLLAMISACTHKQNKLVSNQFADSLIHNYTISALAKGNLEEMKFWKNRINPSLPGYVNESRYAGCLALQFHFFGDIDSLKKSDSVLEKVNVTFNFKEASANLALASHSITEHRFMQADSFLQKAKDLGIKPYESHAASFDVDFELGKYSDAKGELNAMKNPADYGYWFRRSKMEHVFGTLDSSIAFMLNAAANAGASKYLEEVALTNAGDLYIHAADMQKAHDLYMQAIRSNSTDFHSMIGLGWIALVHDHNDSLAEKIFQFVHAKNKLPDALFKLEQVMDMRNDTAAQLKYASAFEQKATAAVYGRMYNKYLLQLYTGILNDPARAEALAHDELNNRATAQTYAWYVWALFKNNKKDEAYKIFEGHVSGKPLEGPELYWMGIVMDGLNKNYNAREFLKAAYKNKYDLDPSAIKYIEKKLDE